MLFCQITSLRQTLSCQYDDYLIDRRTILENVYYPRQLGLFPQWGKDLIYSSHAVACAGSDDYGADFIACFFHRQAPWVERISSALPRFAIP